MKKSILAAFMITVVSFSGVGRSKSIRASDMTTEQWAQLTASGPQDLIVEFRQGDEVPLTFSSEGSLLESIQTGVSYVKVKRSFWIQLQKNEAKISLDGITFKPLREIITGSFTAEAGTNSPGVPVNAINLILKASLK